MAHPWLLGTNILHSSIHSSMSYSTTTQKDSIQTTICVLRRNSLIRYPQLNGLFSPPCLPEAGMQDTPKKPSSILRSIVAACSRERAHRSFIASMVLGMELCALELVDFLVDLVVDGAIESGRNSFLGGEVVNNCGIVSLMSRLSHLKDRDLRPFCGVETS